MAGRRPSKERVNLDQLSDDLKASKWCGALCRDPALRCAAAVKEALDAWLEELPINGVELAPDLAAPGPALHEVFRRGTLLKCSKGQRMVEEGADVRQFTIVLQGQCQMRCRLSKKQAADDEDAEAGDGNNHVTLDAVGRGESFGLIPGEGRAQYEVQCLEPCMLLQLSGSDYAATLAPHIRELQRQALQFLQNHGVCSQGTPTQLQRLASALRPRQFKRGSYLLKVGESQRHVWILREGSCSVLAYPQDAGGAIAIAHAEAQKEADKVDEKVENIAETIADLAADEAHSKHLDHMRTTSTFGGVHQQAAATNAQQLRENVPHARGTHRKRLQGVPTPSPLGINRRGGLALTAVVQDPGALLGEDVLLKEGIREQAAAQSVYTFQVDVQSSFYVVDITNFRQLVLCIGSQRLAENSHEKLTRRCGLLGRANRVEKIVVAQSRRTRQHEDGKEDWQQLRLPPSVGYQGVQNLADTNDYLKVVYNHRTNPPNNKNPQSLATLECLGWNPQSSGGPGVAALVRASGDPIAWNEHQAKQSLAMGRIGGGETSMPSGNPMGDAFPYAAKYGPLSSSASDQGLSVEMTHDAASFGSAGFFFTELELDGAHPQADTTRGMPSRTSSVPVLPRLHDEQNGEIVGASASLHSSVGSMGAVGSKSPGKIRSKAAVGPEAARDRRVMRAFNRAILGRSLLVLTDKGDTRKAVSRALISTKHNAQDEVDLVFVKNRAELLQRLSDMKEQYHALLLDLSKAELHVDSLLPLLREHERYNRLPIIVMSAQTELSEIVRNHCSFVVFHPLAATMLREALLWCFDRKALLLHSTSYGASESCDEPRSPSVTSPSPTGDRTAPAASIHDASLCVIASADDLRSHARRELRT